MWKSGVRIAAGRLQINRRFTIRNDTVCYFPAPASSAAKTHLPAINHAHRCFSSSKSTKSSITKTKKAEGKKSKPKGGYPGAAGAEDGEFGGSGGDDLEAARAKRLADDDKIPSLDVGPHGKTLFTHKDTTTLSQLSHKNIGSYFKFDEASLKAVLPEGLVSGIEDEFKESWRPALLVRKSFLALRGNFRRIVDPPMWLSKELSLVKDVPVLIAINQYNSWFAFSEFEEPVTPRSCRPIHARELTTL